jgi:hypothetical protein
MVAELTFPRMVDKKLQGQRADTSPGEQSLFR